MKRTLIKFGDLEKQNAKTILSIISGTSTNVTLLCCILCFAISAVGGVILLTSTDTDAILGYFPLVLGAIWCLIFLLFWADDVKSYRRWQLIKPTEYGITLQVLSNRIAGAIPQDELGNGWPWEVMKAIKQVWMDAHAELGLIEDVEAALAERVVENAEERRRNETAESVLRRGSLIKAIAQETAEAEAELRCST